MELYESSLRAVPQLFFMRQQAIGAVQLTMGPPESISHSPVQYNHQFHLFYRQFGTKCAGCNDGISPNELVRKARDQVFHLKCFMCVMCRKQLSTGEELYILNENRFLCKTDYMNSKNKDGKFYLIRYTIISTRQDEDERVVHGIRMWQLFWPYLRRRPNYLAYIILPPVSSLDSEFLSRQSNMHVCGYKAKFISSYVQ